MPRTRAPAILLSGDLKLIRNPWIWSHGRGVQSEIALRRSIQTEKSAPVWAFWGCAGLGGGPEHRFRSGIRIRIRYTHFFYIVRRCPAAGVPRIGWGEVRSSSANRASSSRGGGCMRKSHVGDALNRKFRRFWPVPGRSVGLGGGLSPCRIVGGWGGGCGLVGLTAI